MWVEFGIDKKRLRKRRLEARFQLTVQREGHPPETLLDRTLDSDSESPWRGRWIRLARFSYQKVKLCISTDVSGEVDKPERVVAWGNPLIKCPIQHRFEEKEEERISERERKLREQQLKALGYVN
jgi:hypothetical protein